MALPERPTAPRFPSRRRVPRELHAWAAAGLGLVAGLTWFGWCGTWLARPSGEFATEPLNFYTWENIILLAQPRNEPHALRLPLQPHPQGGYEYRLRLDFPDYTGPMGDQGPDRWVRDFGLRTNELRTVGLYLEAEAGADAPWQREVPLGIAEGELQLPDGNRLSLQHPERARRGRLLEFAPTGGRAEPGGGGELRLRTSDGRSLFLRGIVRPLPTGSSERSMPPLGRLVTVVPTLPGQEPGTSNLFYPEGRVTYPLAGAPPSRLALLARAHETPVSALVWGLVAGGVCLGVGAWLIVRSTTVAGAAGWAAGVGVGAALLGLTLPTALIVPPYHGPDEARHPLSYARLVGGDPGLFNRFLALGQLGHAESIRSRPDMKLSAATFHEPEGFFVNRGILEPTAIDNFVPDYRRRSPVVARLWAMTGPLFEAWPAGRIVLGLRLLNVGAGALLVGLGAGVLSASLPRGAGRWAAAAPVFLFALPGFLGGLSNYAILAGAAGAVAGCVGAIAQRPDSGGAAAGVLGLALGVALHTSVNAAVLVLGVGLWLLHRPAARWIESRQEGSAVSARRVLGWWTAFAAGFVAVRGLTTPEFNHELQAHARSLAGIALPPALGSAVAPVAVAVCLGLALIEISLAGGTLRRRRGGGGDPRTGAGGAAFLPWFMAAALVLTAVVFTFVRPPTLADLEQPWRQYPGLPTSGCPLRTLDEVAVPVDSLPRAEQALEVLRVFWCNQTLVPADFVLVRAFWTGTLNGDVRVPWWVATLGVGLYLGGLVGGLVGVARRGSSATIVSVALGVVAFGGALAVAAALYWPRNLYGRYALPLLVVLFSVACLGWRDRLDALGTRRPWWAATAPLALLLTLHASWVACVVRRFF